MSKHAPIDKRLDSFLGSGFNPASRPDYHKFVCSLANDMLRLTRRERKKHIYRVSKRIYRKYFGTTNLMANVNPPDHDYSFPEDLESSLEGLGNRFDEGFTSVTVAGKQDLIGKLKGDESGRSQIRRHNDLTKLLEFLARNHSYIKRRHDVTGPMGKLSKRISMDVAAHWIKTKFKLYDPKTGRVRDYDNGRLTLAEAKDYALSIGFMAGFGLESPVRESRWFNKEKTPARFTEEDTGKEIPGYFDIDENIQTLSGKDIQNLLSTFPMRGVMNLIIPSIKPSYVRSWIKLNQNENESLIDEFIPTDKIENEEQRQAMWMATRINAGPYALKWFLENTPYGKIVALKMATEDIDSHVAAFVDRKVDAKIVGKTWKRTDDWEVSFPDI